jgi:hypothetical protein
LPPFFIISEEEGYLVGFVEFDMQLLCRKHILLRIYRSARTESKQHQQRHHLIFYLKKNMKHKKLIKIPPYYIDALLILTVYHLVDERGITDDPLIGSKVSI